MVEPSANIGSMLRVSRTYDAPREKVFSAWTEPEQIKKWWGIESTYTTPIAEVDLRTGGRYRLGMQAPDTDQVYIVSGVFHEVLAPEKLVYSWAWEGEAMTDMGDEETVVTVEFIERGSSTELVLTHERLPNDQARDQHSAGWNGLLERLAAALKER